MTTRFTFTSIGIKAVQAIGRILIHCWAVAGATLLSCLLLYWVLGGFLPFLLLCFAATGILYQLEDYLLFHPDLPPHSRLFVSLPSVFGLPYESVYTRSSDGTLLHLFVILQPGECSSKAPTLLFFHGNAGNIGHRLQNMVGLYQSLHCNIVMLEYRGYGLSEGTPSEEGICMDARAALDFIASRKDFNHKEIILFGRSLGGAVAIDVSRHYLYSQKIWCLIIENSFTSIPDMARILLGWRILRRLPLICYKSKFLSKEKISQVKVPTLFVSGLADTLVPSRMMKELYDLCSSPHKKLLEFPTGTHNETWTCQGYYHGLDAFIRDARNYEMTGCRGDAVLFHLQLYNLDYDLQPFHTFRDYKDLRSNPRILEATVLCVLRRIPVYTRLGSRLKPWILKQQKLGLSAVRTIQGNNLFLDLL